MQKISFALGFFIIALIVGTDASWARGGGPALLSSPGYERRLQESRGQVTMQSSPAPVAQLAVPPKKKRRHHN